jgi:hypothetical protein
MLTYYTYNVTSILSLQEPHSSSFSMIVWEVEFLRKLIVLHVLHWVTAKIPKRLFTQTQTQLFGFPHFLKRRQNSPKHLFINLTEFNDYIE